MPTALVDLDIGEVSGVDHPAHLSEGWMVLKAAGASPDTIAQVEAVEALVDAVEKAAQIDPEMLALVGAEVLDDEGRQTLAALLPDSPPIHKATQEAPDMPEFDKASLSPEALAYVESLEGAVAKAAAAPAASEDPEATELAKALEGLPEPIRKAFAKQSADLAEATRVAKAERDTRLDAEYLAKARGFDALTVKPEELAKSLRAVADVSPEVFVQLDQVLKAANEQVRTAELFKSAGSPAVIREGDGSAASQLDAIAKQLVLDDKALDYPTALAKAAGDHPDLYAAHRRESITASQEG